MNTKKRGGIMQQVVKLKGRLSDYYQMTVRGDPRIELDLLLRKLGANGHQPDHVALMNEQAERIPQGIEDLIILLPAWTPSWCEGQILTLKHNGDRWVDYWSPVGKDFLLDGTCLLVY